MALLNIAFPNEERIFKLFDTNDDDHVDYRELVMGLALLREGAPGSTADCGINFYVRLTSTLLTSTSTVNVYGCLLTSTSNIDFCVRLTSTNNINLYVRLITSTSNINLYVRRTSTSNINVYARLTSTSNIHFYVRPRQRHARASKQSAKSDSPNCVRLRVRIMRLYSALYSSLYSTLYIQQYSIICY
eukprot:1178706-Prorocentrum_minimum.AAC.1